MVDGDSGGALQCQENSIQFESLLEDPVFLLEEDDEADEPVEAVPQFLLIHLLLVLDHVGQGEVEVLAVGVDGLVSDA